MSAMVPMVPTITMLDGKLVAETSWFSYLARAGIYSCAVTVDSAKHQVIVRRRILWLWRTERTIPFHQIRSVVYEFHGPRSKIGQLLSEPGDESFTVGLRLENLTHVNLFRFGDYAEEQAKAYAGQLARITGAPLGG